VIGGVIGWLASIIMRTDAQQGILMNIVVGIVAHSSAASFFSGGTINQVISLNSVLVSLLGAVILLALGQSGSPRHGALGPAQPAYLPTLYRRT
jgi:uncharacterized membrane protein YeaQ/YmgE (transglycosylase-associated protein family)